MLLVFVEMLLWLSNNLAVRLLHSVRPCSLALESAAMPCKYGQSLKYTVTSALCSKTYHKVY